MSTFYSLYIPRALKGIDLQTQPMYKSIKSINFEGTVSKYFTSFHFSPVKTFSDWAWSKYVYFLSTFPIKDIFCKWEDDSEIKNYYKYWFGKDILTFKSDWFNFSKTDLKDICNNGPAAHMVVWNKDCYMVDLSSFSNFKVRKGLFPYGATLVLDSNLNPKHIRLNWTPTKDGYVKQDLTSYKDDEDWDFASSVFLSSLLLKITLIDKTLCSRFIYSGNVISSVFNFKNKLPKEFIDFVTPFIYNTVKTNERVKEEFGLYERVFGLEYLERFLITESNFWFWESPKELFHKNIFRETPKNRELPGDMDYLTNCTSCETNRAFPRWYWDAIKYWDEVEKFVDDWITLFYKNITRNEKRNIEDWLIFYENKKPGTKDFHSPLKIRLKKVLTSLVWNATFFYRHVSIGKWTFRPGNIQSKIYLGKKESSKWDDIGLATISLLCEGEHQPLLLGELWKLQHEKYSDIWIKFERCVEKLEFKSLDLIGGELECCI
jgi:hypothetical protein